jgi:hypothetical protein
MQEGDNNIGEIGAERGLSKSKTKPKTAKGQIESLTFSFFLRPWMRNVISVYDVHHGKVRVLLSIGQTRVAQALPDCHDIGAV